MISFLKKKHIMPWTWIPTLYFAEGIPYVIVTLVSVVLYKRIGLENEEITFYTSWLYLPWVIKPFWGGIVDIVQTKRWWIIVMQLLIGTCLAGIAYTIPCRHYLQFTLAFFWLIAFCSSTHDIAADGFYMIALDKSQQSFYVGIRSTFYRISTIVAQGLLIMIAGTCESFTHNTRFSWKITFIIISTVFLLLAVYHLFVFFKLSTPKEDIKKTTTIKTFFSNFISTFTSFFRKPQIIPAILFLFFYRFPEALLSKVCPLFFLDATSKGGLGLSTAQLGMVQGTIGIIGLLIGGIIGGISISKYGFKKCLWPMVTSITLPNIIYILLAYSQPSNNLFYINVSVFIEQFGYGFGFTAYMMYMIYFSQGDNKTTHYAFCTGYMALSMMIPGLFSGALEELLGYLNFFILVMILTPVTFLVAAFIKVEKDFGKEKQE